MRTMGTLLVLCVALSFAACGGGSDGTSSTDTTGGPETTDVAGDPDAPEACTDCGDGSLTDEDVVLEFLSPGDITAIEQHVYPIQIRSYRVPSYEPTRYLKVQFALSGDGDATLDPTEVRTDDNGMAEVSFSAGTTVGAVYTLTVTAEDAAPVTQTITIVGLATGSAIVTPVLHFTPEGGESMTLWMVPGTYVCGQTGPLDKPADTFKEIQVTDLTTPLTIEALPEAPRWAVVALIDKADGNPLASGCVDDFAIVAQGEPTPVTLDLAKLDLNATATYAFTFTTSLAPWVDPALADIPTHLQEHFTAATLQQTLHDGFFQALDQKVHTEHAGYKASAEACPEGTDPAICQQWCVDLIHAELDANLAQHLANLPGPWDQLADFYDVATALASTVQLTGQIEVKAHVFAPPAHYEYEIRPTALTLPDCGAASCTWTAEALKDVQYGMEWGDPAKEQGTIGNYDQVQVDAFALPVDANRVALLVLTEVLGPQALGTTDLYGWFHARFGCDTLAPMFSGDFRTCTWSGAEDFQAICDDLVDEYNAPLEAWLNPLATQRVPELGQQLTGHDPDGNLEIDTADGTVTWTVPGGGSLDGTVTWARP